MKTETINFTKASIEGITPPTTGRATYRDERGPHLHLRVTSKGVKSFVVIRKVDGVTRFVTLGKYPDLTVSQARLAAVNKTQQLLAGELPRRTRSSRLTFGDLFDAYIAHVSKCDKQGHPRKATWKEDQRKFDKMLQHWAKCRVDDIARDDIQDLHDRLGKTRGIYIANRTLALLKVLFNYGIKQGMREKANPCTGIDKFRETSRRRYLQADELRRFFAALDDKKTSALWRDFFYTLLYTGARRGNVQAMRWQHLDLDAGVWRIPGREFKNGDDFEVVLPAEAVEILRRRLGKRMTSEKYVFTAERKTLAQERRKGHITDPRKAWFDVVKRAGLTNEDGAPNVRIHDLRRTLGTWQAATGASTLVIGKTLGHRDTKSTAIYARVNMDPVRDSVSTALAAMRVAADSTAPDESVELDDAASA